MTLRLNKGQTRADLRPLQIHHLVHLAHDLCDLIENNKTLDDYWHRRLYMIFDETLIEINERYILQGNTPARVRGNNVAQSDPASN